MSATETSAVAWGGTLLPYAIRRSARRKKTVAVTVDPAGGVVLLAPEHLSPDELDRIVARKAVWIVRRLRHAESQGPLPSPREFVSDESVLYLGRHYRLKVQPHASGEAKLCGGWLHVPAPEGARQPARVRDALIAWFRRHAEKRLPERVAAWRAKAGVPMPPVIVSNQQERWGSCDRNGAIRLNCASSRPPCDSWTTSSSMSWCICGTADTAATTGRPSDGSCRTTSGGGKI